MAKKKAAKGEEQAPEPKTGTSALVGIDEDGKVRVIVSHCLVSEINGATTKKNEDVTDMLPAGVKKDIVESMKAIVKAAGPHVEQYAKADQMRYEVAMQGGPQDPSVKKLDLKSDLKSLGEAEQKRV